MRQVLVTGATGFVGRVFTRALLDDYPDLHVWALVRGKDGAPPAHRPELRDLVANPRFHVVDGDLTQPTLGAMPAAVFGASHGAEVVPDELDAVFHLAAQTEFKESKREQTFQVNVDGTKNLLALLASLRRVGKLFHVSTAYVSGLRPGQEVKEELLPFPDRFANPYEESKHATEWVVSGSSLDWTILRLSIVVGDSRTGEAESDKMMYGAFKVYWRLRGVLENKYTPEQMAALPPGRFAVPVRPEVLKNLVCVDDVVRLMVAAVRAGPPSGTVLNIVNPVPSTTAEMHEAICAVLGLRCLRADPVHPAQPAAEELLIQRGMEVYEPYTNVQEPRFDQARLRALVGDEAVDAVMPATVERLRFLFGSYLKQRLEASVQTVTITVTERLAHVQRHGRGALAYSSLRPAMLALPVKGDGGGYVPLAIKGRTAAMVGDPVCAPSTLPAGGGHVPLPLRAAPAEPGGRAGDTPGGRPRSRSAGATQTEWGTRRSCSSAEHRHQACQAVAT